MVIVLAPLRKHEPDHGYTVDRTLSIDLADAVDQPVAVHFQHAGDLGQPLTLCELGYHVAPLGTATQPAARAPARPEPAPEPAEIGPHLSPRETTILEHLLGGLSNKCIANRLGITETTVKVHLRSAYRKIGVSNRTQAAMWAAQEIANGNTEATPS
jgi:DNA-binding CsgD family transcriptional regulator